ncbi:unnamed protein product, partial [Ectocarpus sp. 8 AP-2014]
RLENRLSFSFLPGLSWPGHRQEAVPSAAVSAAAAAAAAGAAGQGSADTVVIRRRNLAGLPPPVGKNASEAAEADAAATVDVSSLQEADDNFLLQPTPQGLKSYCIIQRTRSTIRTYFRLFLQEQRPLAEDGGGGDGGDDSASPTTTSGPATGVPGGHGATPPTTSNSTGLDGGSGGGAFSATGGSASGGVTHSGGGMETLRAFLAVGGGGGGGGAGGNGAVGGAQFLLSSKRYRSTKPRSASYVWSRNGVWKDKHALAKVATQPWGGKGKGEGTMTSPSLVGDHLRAATAAAAAAAAAASPGPRGTWGRTAARLKARRCLVRAAGAGGGRRGRGGAEEA